MGYIAGSVAATTAAAAAKRRRDQEEEEMTHYTSEDLNEGWEFKIVRSTFEEFRNPAKLRQVIDEEACAGWELVEKFDNARLRFKRPASARERDHLLPPDVDPYRVSFGTFNVSLILTLVVGLTALLVAGTVALVLAL